MLHTGFKLQERVLQVYCGSEESGKIKEDKSCWSMQLLCCIYCLCSWLHTVHSPAPLPCARSLIRPIFDVYCSQAGCTVMASLGLSSDHTPSFSPVTTSSGLQWSARGYYYSDYSLNSALCHWAQCEAFWAEVLSLPTQPPPPGVLFRFFRFFAGGGAFLLSLLQLCFMLCYIHSMFHVFKKKCGLTTWAWAWQ